jgi:putative ABC transport system permease protein
MSSRGRVLRTLPWRRAPMLLARQPLVASVLLLAATVLAMAAATAPLFLSTIGTASLHSAAAQRCPEQAMPAAITNASGLRPADNALLTKRFSTAYERAGLAPARNVVWASAVLSADASSGLSVSGPAYVFSAPGATRHIDKLRSIGGSGIWLNRYEAAQFHVKPGAFLSLNGKKARVVGIYKTLAHPNDPGFQLARAWCTWHNIVVPNGVVEQRPPSFIIADSQSFAVSVSSSTHAAWYSTIDVSSMSLTQAEAAAQAGIDAINRVAHTQHGMRAPITADPTFKQMTGRAAHIQQGLSGAIVPIAVGGIVVALLLVVGAGWFWALRRRREIELMVARGVGPAPLAAKALLETMPWVLLGGGLGLGLTLVLIKRLAPSPELDGHAIWQATGLVLLVDAAAALIIAAIGATRGREVAHVHRMRLRALRWVPWELALIGAAVAIRLTTHGQGITVDDEGTVQLGPAVLAFPLLGLAGTLLLLVRIMRRGMPALRRFARRGRMGRFLAFTRIATSPAVALGVIVGIALPCGMLVYASGLQSSLNNSVTAKYQTNLGAPHVLSTVSVFGRTLAMHGTGTQVSVIQQAPVGNNGQPLRLLGVDPATFSQFAYVDSKEKALVAQLHGRSADGSVPAIVANSRGAGPITSIRVATTTSSVRIRPRTLPVHVIATLEAFPGLRDAYQPIVIVNRQALRNMPLHIERAEQIWTSDAEHAAAAANLARQHVSVLYELSPDVVVTKTGLLPVTWVLAYLRALALLIGLVAIAGLVFALGARTRRAALAYVLSRRMGVSRATHLGSLLRELALIVGLGWLIGSGLAEGGVGAVYRLLDTYPQIPPRPVFVFDGVVVAALAGACAALVVVAAGLAQVLADRADAARTMRAL